MPTTEVILIVAVIAMFIVIVWLISKLKAKEQTHSQPSAQPQPKAEISTIKFDPSVLEKKHREIVRDPKNPRHIEEVKALHESIVDMLANTVCENLHPYAEQYTATVEYLNQEREEWTYGNITELVNIVKIGQCRSAAEKEYSELGDFFIDTYNEMVSYLKDIFTDDLIDGFMLNDDAAMSERNKLLMALKQDMGSYSVAMNELQATQSKLKSMLPRAIEILGDKGWGDFFKGGVAGAVAVANPFVGIPLALGHIFGSTQKQKQNNAYIDEVSQTYDEYTEKLDELRENARETYEKQVIQMKKRLNLLHAQNLTKMLIKLDEKGHSLAEVVTYFKDIKDEWDKAQSEG